MTTPMFDRVRAATFLTLLLASSASSGAEIALGPVPTGAMTKVPGHAPAHVSASEHVSGVFVAQAPVPPQSRNYQRINVLDSKKDADTFARKGYLENPKGTPPKVCLFATDDSLEAGDSWPALARGEITAFSGSGQNPIIGVHVEKIEDGAAPGRGASLGIIDAWLDTRTRGLKLVAKATIPLGLVAEGPYRIRVLAARTDDVVHFVVLPPTPEANAETFESQVGRALIESGSEVGASQCRHSRLSLEARPGSGEHAIVTFQHVVKPKTDPLDAKPTDAEAPIDLTTSRTQLVQVHLSASRNTATSEPVVSVSFRLDKPKPFGV